MPENRVGAESLITEEQPIASAWGLHAQPGSVLVSVMQPDGSGNTLQISAENFAELLEESKRQRVRTKKKRKRYAKKALRCLQVMSGQKLDHEDAEHAACILVMLIVSHPDRGIKKQVLTAIEETLETPTCH